MEQHISKLLATSPLFAQMAEPAIAQALDAVGWRAVTYRPHDVYALAGSACMYVDIVLTGEMVAWMVAASGRRGRGGAYLRRRRDSPLLPVCRRQTDAGNDRDRGRGHGTAHDARLADPGS